MQNEIQYAVKSTTYFLKFIGVIGYHSCPGLEKLINLNQNKFELYVIDLSLAQRIDSTVIGILAKITKLQKDSKPILIGLKKDIMIILSNMGLIDYFEVIPKYDNFPQKLKNIRGILKSINKDDKSKLLKKIIKNK